MDNENNWQDYARFREKTVKVYSREDFSETKDTIEWQGYGSRVDRGGDFANYSSLIEKIKEGDIKTVIKGTLIDETLQRITLQEVRFCGKTLAEDYGFGGNSAFERSPRLISIDKKSIAYLEEIDIPEDYV